MSMNVAPSADPARPGQRATVRRPLRPRDREARRCLVGTGLALILFGLWPSLDVVVTGWFRSAAPDVASAFVGNQWAPVVAVYEAVPWFGRAAGLAGLLVALLAWARPGRLPLHWRRPIVALALSMLLGVALLTNGALKEHFGWARPNMVETFGGTVPFKPVLSLHDECRHNCSFVSGHAATGFALMSLGLLGAPRIRRRWWWIGVAAGSLIGLGRISQGGHFLSDIVFAGLLMQASHVTLRLAWLRWVLVRRRRRHRLTTIARLDA